MDAQRLFNNTLKELQERIQAGDEYSILMTAGLIRKLIVDNKNSLILHVNKTAKSIEFNINAREPLHKRHPSLFSQEVLKTYQWFAGDGLCLDKANITKDFKPKKLNLDQFLKYTIIFSNNEDITVKDLIKYLANKEGAIHKQKVLNNNAIKDLLLKELYDHFKIGNLPSCLYTLKSVAIIVEKELSKFRS